MQGLTKASSVHKEALVTLVPRKGLDSMQDAGTPGRGSSIAVWEVYESWTMPAERLSIRPVDQLVKDSQCCQCLACTNSQYPLCKQSL